MAKKNETNNVGVESTDVPARKLDLKKIIVVLVVMVVIVAVALVADKQINSRPVTDINDATNRLFGAGVLANHPEIVYDTPVSIENLDPERIDGKMYYPIEVILYYETPEAKTLPLYYIEQKTGDVYVKDSNDKMVPWGV